MPMTNKIKDVIGLACSLADIQLCTLNMLGLIVSHTSLVLTIERKPLIEQKSMFKRHDISYRICTETYT